MKKLKQIIAFIITIILISSIVFPVNVSALTKDTALNVEFINVGQGDCALIECNRHYMLIDGGPSSASSIVYTVLKNKHISHLDCIIATHPDEDHIGGLSGALNFAKADICYSPVTEYDTKAFDNLIKYLNKNSTGLTVPVAGTSFNLGSAKVSIIGPVTYSEESNNNSIVVKITYGSTSFLFMGDAEFEEESSLISSGAVLKCDVLKVGHHGSSGSTSASFINYASPTYGVISVGKDNNYGHPTDTTLKTLKSSGVKIYRTDKQGDITFSSDGKNITVEMENTETTGNPLLPANPITPNNTRIISSDSPAVQSSSGSFGDGNSIPIPDGTTYVLNNNTHKFHYPSCDSVSDISEKNIEFSNATYEDIIANGYSPCMKCNPR